MKVNFIDDQKGLVRTKDLDIIPRKGDVIKYMSMTFYIEEISFDLEKVEYNIYMYKL